MKFVETDYAIIPFNNSVKIGAYVFNEDVGVCGPSFQLKDGREGVGSLYFGLGLAGLVTKLVGGSPKPRIQVVTRVPYTLKSEIVDKEVMDEIKDKLTLKCAEHDCKTPTRYAVKFTLWEAMGCSRNRTTNVCYDHINEFIEDGMKVYGNKWNVFERKFPIEGSRYKELGRIRI